MIYGFFGDMGSGKTLSMTRFAFLFYKKGYEIYSNYPLAFPHTLIDKEFLSNIVKENTEFDGDILMVLDEVDMYIDSRRSMGKDNLSIGYFIKQVRKKRLKLMYSAQMEHAVDKRLRQLTRTEIVCKARKIILDGKQMKEPCEITFIDQQIYINGDDKGTKTFCGNPYFKLYDTRNLITT